jgi:hypothetical protein
MEKIISEQEYDDLIAKLLVEGLNEEERKKIDAFQKALRTNPNKKTDPTEKRKKVYRNELKRRLGYDYDAKVLNESDPKHKENIRESHLKVGDKVMMKGVKVEVIKKTKDGYVVKEVSNPKKEKIKSMINKLKESITPAFQKELFRILRNHYPNATVEDMQKVVKFIDRNCNR